jgi:hypothetical protein
MLFGGGLNDDLGGFICAEKARASTTEEQREIVRIWLAAREEVVSVAIGPLKDAWHGDFDD